MWGAGDGGGEGRGVGAISGYVVKKAPESCIKNCANMSFLFYKMLWCSLSLNDLPAGLYMYLDFKSSKVQNAEFEMSVTGATVM